MSSLEIQPNPFTITYNALWDLALSNRNLQLLVLEKNRIKFTEPAGGKRNISQADLPELLLMPSGATTNLHATSSSTTCNRSYVWALQTGSMQLDERFNPIMWELFTSMSAFCMCMTKLTWMDHPFITNVELPDEADSPFETEGERGIRGWSALMSVEVRMSFRTKDLFQNLDLNCLTCK